MKMLILALYPEGSTDARFLPPIIQRTAERIIAQHGQDVVDVSELVIVPKQQHQRREACILSAARHICHCHALINFKKTLAELNFISWNYLEER